MTKSERNSEIHRRALAGDAHSALAREYGVSRQRIFEIVRGRQRERTLSRAFFAQARRDFCQFTYLDPRWPNFGRLPCGKAAYRVLGGAGYCKEHFRPAVDLVALRRPPAPEGDAK